MLDHCISVDIKPYFTSIYMLRSSKMKTNHPASQQQEIGSELLTVTEAADCLRLKVSTIRAWVLRRRIPFIKLGGKRVFFRRADLDAFIVKCVVPAKRDAA
jgi:excisionase family DNA binding protein